MSRERAWCRSGRRSDGLEALSRGVEAGSDDECRDSAVRTWLLAQDELAAGVASLALRVGVGDLFERERARNLYCYLAGVDESGDLNESRAVRFNRKCRRAHASSFGGGAELGGNTTGDSDEQTAGPKDVK